MPKKANSSPDEKNQPAAAELRATSKTVPLPSGLFLFTVRKATPEAVAEAGGLMFPAMHVAPGPGCPDNVIEFVGSPQSMGTWLYRQGDRLVVKVAEPGATLVLTSVRAEGTQVLDVILEPVAGTSRAVTPVARPEAAVEPAGAAHAALKLQLNLHVRNFGDLSFVGTDWAGLLAENLWVEAMGIVPQEGLSPHDIEYKTLSASGFESPWLSDGAVSGSKGRGMPLVGFAIRLRPEAAGQHDCEYSGYFQSGASVGPVRNGVPCRSKVASDPLVGIKLRVAKRVVVAKAGAPLPAAAAAATAATGPRFSKFRQGAGKDTTPARTKPAAETAPSGKAKPAAKRTTK